MITPALRQLVVLLLIFVVSCRAEPNTVTMEFHHPNGDKSPSIQSEMMNTPELRNLGMMYRKELPEKRGMLFIFPKEEPRHFWMKNTYIELDMIFLNKDMEVVSVLSHVPPLTTEGRSSEKPAMYVLEIGGGLAAKWGIVPKSRLKIAGSIPSALN